MVNILTIHGVWGGVFALTSALMWAIAAILFMRLGDKVSPLGMNLGKGIVAIICLGILLLLTDTSSVTNHTFLFLGISGLLGITFGDTFYFMALIRLGPRLVLILATLIPVATVFLAVLILQERPSFISWLGILLTLLGVTWVLWERTPIRHQLNNWKTGIKYGVLSVLCCASGVIFSKMVIESTSALKATFIRQLWGVVGLILWGFIGFHLKSWLRPLANPILLKRLLFASFVGTFLGTWLCLSALKYTDASIAATLNSTSPIFILPLAFFILKEKISFRAIISSVIAVLGVGLIFFG